MGIFSFFKKKKTSAQENSVKGELPKESLQSTQEHNINEAVTSLRDKILQSIVNAREPKLKFELADLLYQDAASCFPKLGFQWDGAWFILDLETGRITAEVSTYPNQFGAYRQSSFPLSASGFNEIAKRYNMPWDLQLFESDEDWARLFDDDLKAAVATTRAVLQKQAEKRKNEEKQWYAVKIHTNILPNMSISEVTLVLSQRYSIRKVNVTKENGTYHIVYDKISMMSSDHERHFRALEPSECGWLELKVNNAIHDPDNSTWQSLPGGDSMEIVIKQNNGENIVLSHTQPLKKYSDMMNDLEKLAQYGSCKVYIIQEKVSEILSGIDFRKSNRTVFIRDSGDPSRYHETVALQCHEGKWSLLEDYLTPEFSFTRREKIPRFRKSNAAEWLEAFILQNEVLLDNNRTCPRDGLCLPAEKSCP